MTCVKYLVLILVIPHLCDGVNVNMRGSLTVGEDIVKTLRHLVNHEIRLGSRRSMSGPSHIKKIDTLVKSSNLCQDLEICELQSKEFIKEFITTLTITLEDLFIDITQVTDERKAVLKEKDLKLLLGVIRQLLINGDAKLRQHSSKEAAIHIWTTLIKKIVAKYQSWGLDFLFKGLEGTSSEVNDGKEILMKKLIVLTSVVEGQFLYNLCVDMDMCAENIYCTKGLNSLLKKIQNMPEEKVKHFIKAFHRALESPKLSIYTHLSNNAVSDFQAVLNDMTYSTNVPAKEIMISLKKAVAQRIKFLEEKKRDVTSQDVQLLHIILSDLDHYYSKYKTDPFKEFVTHIDDMNTVSELTMVIEKVLTEMSTYLAKLSNNLQIKLEHEIKVFLGLTISSNSK